MGQLAAGEGGGHMRKGIVVPEERFRIEGYCDVERVYDGREVKCVHCGRRVRFSISRYRGESGYHEISGACECGRFKVAGTVDIKAVVPARKGAA